MGYHQGEDAYASELLNAMKELGMVKDERVEPYLTLFLKAIARANMNYIEAHLRDTDPTGKNPVEWYNLG